MYPNGKHKTIKFLVNIGENLDDFEFSNQLLDTVSKARSVKKQICETIKIEKHSTVKHC